MRSRSIYGAFLLFVSALFGGATELPAQLSVDSLEVFIDPGNATTRMTSIVITNETDSPIEAAIDVQDWERDASGMHDFRKYGALSNTCGSELNVFPKSVMIEGGRTGQVNVTFEGAATKTCQAIVFIQARPNASAAKPQMNYIIKTGVKVYVRQKDAAPSRSAGR